jgi:hypothetical protein
VTFLETVAESGAQYTLNNKSLLLMQAAMRQMTQTFFLPYGKKDGTSGWKKYGRHVREGETGFKVWAPVKRRPTEEEAARWEAAGRKVTRDEQGRPVVQVVGFPAVAALCRFAIGGRVPRSVVRRLAGRRSGELRRPASPAR